VPTGQGVPVGQVHCHACGAKRVALGQICLEGPFPDLALAVGVSGKERGLGQGFEIRTGETAFSVRPVQQLVRFLPGVTGQRLTAGLHQTDAGERRRERHR